jgi:hypothetical protein
VYSSTAVHCLLRSASVNARKSRSAIVAGGMLLSLPSQAIQETERCLQLDQQERIGPPWLQKIDRLTRNGIRLSRQLALQPVTGLTSRSGEWVIIDSDLHHIFPTMKIYVIINSRANLTIVKRLENR